MTTNDQKGDAPSDDRKEKEGQNFSEGIERSTHSVESEDTNNVGNKGE